MIENNRGFQGIMQAEPGLIVLEWSKDQSAFVGKECKPWEMSCQMWYLRRFGNCTPGDMQDHFIMRDIGPLQTKCWFFGQRT